MAKRVFYNWIFKFILLNHLSEKWLCQCQNLTLDIIIAISYSSACHKVDQDLLYNPENSPMQETSREVLF